MSVSIREFVGQDPGTKSAFHHALVDDAIRYDGTRTHIDFKGTEYQHSAFCMNAQPLAHFIPRKFFPASAIRWNQLIRENDKRQPVRNAVNALQTFCHIAARMGAHEPKHCGHGVHDRCIASVTLVPPEGKVSDADRKILERGKPHVSEKQRVKEYQEAVERTELKDNEEIGFLLQITYAITGGEDSDLRPPIERDKKTGEIEPLRPFQVKKMK